MIDTLAGDIDLCQYVLVAAPSTLRLIADRCSPVFFAPLGQRDAEEMAEALRILADPARLRILSLIANHPGGEVCQAQFTGPLGLSQPTVSHHLKVLHEAGLLHREPRGSWAYYSIDRRLVKAMNTTLALRR